MFVLSVVFYILLIDRFLSAFQTKYFVKKSRNVTVISDPFTNG
jgi:hypothetical protein